MSFWCLSSCSCSCVVGFFSSSFHFLRCCLCMAGAAHVPVISTWFQTFNELQFQILRWKEIESTKSLRGYSAKVQVCMGVCVCVVCFWETCMLIIVWQWCCKNGIHNQICRLKDYRNRCGQSKQISRGKRNKHSIQCEHERGCVCVRMFSLFSYG